MRPRIALLNADNWLLSLPVRLSTALVAAVGLLLGLLMARLRPEHPELAGLCFFGAWAIISVPVLAGAARGLLHRGKELNPYYLDQFVAIVLLACLAGERYATGAIVSIILIFGQLLEERSVRGIREAIDGLSRLSRLSARRLRGDTEEVADAETLAVGDRLRVLPGELIPADGRVVRGQSAINQAAITGESLPVDVGPDDDVFAGTLNLSGVILLETSRVATETVIGRVRAILEAATADKPLIARRIDAYLRYYTPAVLMLTAMTWILTKDLDRAVSVLVVCLPCAFVLSGPSVMVAGLAVCARLGILVKTRATSRPPRRSMQWCSTRPARSRADTSRWRTWRRWAASRLRPAFPLPAASPPRRNTRYRAPSRTIFTIPPGPRRRPPPGSRKSRGAVCAGGLMTAKCSSAAPRGCAIVTWFSSRRSRLRAVALFSP